MESTVQSTATASAPTANPATGTNRYARTIEVSKRVRWEIERDVIRGRRFDHTRHFLPNGLSKVNDIATLDGRERRLLSQVQGRSYGNIFGLVERFIAAKVLGVSQEHWLGDQVALEALVRMADEEIKHQEMFRRINAMLDADMPEGYTFAPDPNAVAKAVLSKSNWAVLGLTLHIELFVQLHYRESIDRATDICPLWKDVFLFHWKEESQHAILDELEWTRANAELSDGERDAAVDDLIALVGAVDGILQAQSAADADYFVKCCGRPFPAAELATVRDTVLRAYRWQYIVSGVQEPRFTKVLGAMITETQAGRIGRALAPIVQHVNAH
jgi:hypothetical protein